MATYFKPEKSNRWKGTIDDIVGLSNAVTQEIASRTSQTPAYTSRVEGSTLNAEFDDSQQMKSSIKVKDLKSIEKISLTIGDWVERTPLSAVLVFSRASGEPAVVAQTRGRDRVQVEGLLSATIKPFLDGGRRKLNLSNSALYILSLLILVAIIAILIAVPIPYPDMPFVLFWVGNTLVGGLLGFLVFGGVYKFANWIYPQLELLAPGEDTQFKNSRKWVFSAAGGAIGAPLFVGLLIAWLT